VCRLELRRCFGDRRLQRSAKQWYNERLEEPAKETTSSNWLLEVRDLTGRYPRDNFSLRINYWSLRMPLHGNRAPSRC
jgi:hypothetical protein